MWLLKTALLRGRGCRICEKNNVGGAFLFGFRCVAANGSNFDAVRALSDLQVLKRRINAK